MPLEITCKIGAQAFSFALPLGPFNPAALLNSLREQFSTSSRSRRLREFLLVFKSEIDAIQNESMAQTARLEALEAERASPEYAEALRVAAEEAVRTTNARRIERLAIVLANGFDPAIKALDTDELSAFVRDVSQLSELDTRARNNHHRPARWHHGRYLYSRYHGLYAWITARRRRQQDQP